MGTTNTLDLNNRVSALERAVSGSDSAQANKKDIATEFSATTAYTAGCFVYYQGKLYQFNTDHAAGAWDPTDVVEANVTDQVVSNKAAIESVEDAVDEKSKILTTEVTFTVNSSTSLVISRPLNIPSAKIISVTQRYNDDAYNMIAAYHIAGYRLLFSSDNNGMGEAILLSPSEGWSALSSAQVTIIAKVAYLE